MVGLSDQNCHKFNLTVIIFLKFSWEHAPKPLSFKTVLYTMPFAMTLCKDIISSIITIIPQASKQECRVGSGGSAGTVLAEPLFEFLTVLLAINHLKLPTNYLPKSLNCIYLIQYTLITMHIVLLLTHIM